MYCTYYSDVFLEKHWRSVISKSICDYFLEKQKVSPNVGQLKESIKVTIFQCILIVLGYSTSYTNILSINKSGVY